MLICIFVTRSFQDHSIQGPEGAFTLDTILHNAKMQPSYVGTPTSHVRQQTKQQHAHKMKHTETDYSRAIPIYMKA